MSDFMSRIRKQLTILKIVRKIDIELWKNQTDKENTTGNPIELLAEEKTLKNLRKWIYGGGLNG